MRLTFNKDKLGAMTPRQLEEQKRLVNIYYSQLNRGWMTGETSDKQMNRCVEMKKYIERLIQVTRQIKYKG